MSIFLCIFCTNFSSLFAAKTAEKPLIIGTTSGYAPYVSLNDAGKYEGFDIDFIEALSKKLNRSYVLKDCGSMTGLMMALKQKKVDMIIWAISITEERQKKMNMIYYQGDLVSEIPIIFWDKAPENLKQLSDLSKEGAPLLAVEAGSYQVDILKRVPKATLKNLNSITDVILDLKYGKSFASAIDSSLVAKYTEKFPELKAVYLPLPEECQSLGNGICVEKNNIELTKKVQNAVQGIMNEGIVTALEKKWGMRRD